MDSYEKGITNYPIPIWVADSTVFTGAGKTGLTAATATLRWRHGVAGTDTVPTLVALGSPTAAYAANGFIEVDPVNWRGWYRYDPPNSFFATPGDGVREALMMVGGPGAADTPNKFLLTEPVFVAAGAIDAHLPAPELAAILAAIMDESNGIETGLTFRQSVRLIAAVLAGRVSGATTGTEIFRAAVSNAKPRVTATVDNLGNRSAITTDVTP